MPDPKLIVISAPSGGGKTTLCKRLLKDFPKEMALSVSSTTRQPRGSEEDGEDYFFLDRDDFEWQIREGEFAEWAEVHGNYYGTSRQMIEDCLKAGFSLLLDIDVQGGERLIEKYPQQVVRVFIAPPSLESLEDRLRTRGTDSEETIQKRIEAAKTEMLKAREYDMVIMNDDLDRAYSELKTYLVEKLGLD